MIKELIKGKTNYLIINKGWLKGIGTRRATLLATLSDLYEKERAFGCIETDEEGNEWFRCSTEYLIDAIGMQSRSQQRCLKDFEDVGMLKVKSKFFNKQKYRWVAINQEVIKKYALQLNVIEEDEQIDGVIPQSTKATDIVKGNQFAQISTNLIGNCNPNMVKMLWFIACRTDFENDKEFIEFPVNFVQTATGITAPTQKKIIDELVDEKVIEMKMVNYNDRRHRYIKLNLSNFEKYVEKFNK